MSVTVYVDIVCRDMIDTCLYKNYSAPFRFGYEEEDLFVSKGFSEGCYVL